MPSTGTSGSPCCADRCRSPSGVAITNDSLFPRDKCQGTAPVALFSAYIDCGLWPLRFFFFMTSVRQYTTRSTEETIALGKGLVSQLRPPKLVLLRGELGAGKTTLVKGIAEAFDAARAE